MRWLIGNESFVFIVFTLTFSLIYFLTQMFVFECFDFVP